MENVARIQALNDSFGIAGIAQVEPGNGGLPKLQISAASASGEIYLHGAQLTAWRPAGTDEVLFVSARSRWEDGKAIRGGIPVCFPWFRGKADDPKAPTHGFVRTREWQLDSVSHGKDDSVTVQLSTGSDDETRRWWPVDFKAEYRLTIGRELKLEFAVSNTGSSAFQFEEALHTYFRVGDVRRSTVHGLDQVAYLDNRDGNRLKTQTGELKIASQTDNAYLNAAGPVEIIDPELGRRLRTGKEHSESTIVWNPWSDGASALADLGDDEWHQMLCVEGGNIMSSAVRLAPGEKHVMRISIRLTVE